MTYRPICDVWLLARSKVPYYGAFPAGFLERARDLLGVGLEDAVLHVCSGRVKDYPYRGFGPRDQTVDWDAHLMPDFVMDVRTHLPQNPDPASHGYWPALLIDRPYTVDDADQYPAGRARLPNVHDLLTRGLAITRPQGRVGILDCVIPRPPAGSRFVACVGVIVGFGNRGRFFTVFERPAKDQGIRYEP